MITEMLDLVESKSLKKEVPYFEVGDTVDVRCRIREGQKTRVQMFSGIVIARKGRGINETFTVRRVANDEGVELADVRIASPQSVLQINGVVGEGPEYFNSSLELELSARSLAYAGLWLSVHGLPEQEFSLSGSVALDERGWQLNDAVFKSLNVQLKGAGRVDDLLTGSGLNGEF